MFADISLVEKVSYGRLLGTHILRRDDAILSLKCNAISSKEIVDNLIISLNPCIQD